MTPKEVRRILTYLNRHLKRKRLFYMYRYGSQAFVLVNKSEEATLIASTTWKVSSNGKVIAGSDKARTLNTYRFLLTKPMVIDIAVSPQGELTLSFTPNYKLQITPNPLKDSPEQWLLLTADEGSLLFNTTNRKPDPYFTR